ncbi:MAG: NADH-quinone oxidoreductase subunit C [Firmicutes bacterium]|nr:NADH-quinone oxidoreductase subunit C [Bacillota bacterium]
MTHEKEVVSRILERFPVLEGHVRVEGRQRVRLDSLVRRDFDKVFPFLTGPAGFDRLLTLFGTDDGDWLSVTYALVNADEVVLLARERVLRTRPSVRSVCSRFPQAVWQERELESLLGLQVEGLPEGESCPLPAEWPAGSFPLRKDWDVRLFNKSTMTYIYTPAASAGKKEAGR